MKENMFEYATRNKVRFPYKGLISVEDLWDLPLKELDAIYKALNAKAKLAKEESLLSTKSKESEVLDLQIEVVTYIVNLKKLEAEERVKSKEKKEEKQKIMSVLARKKDEDLLNKSHEELEAMLKNLED